MIERETIKYNIRFSNNELEDEGLYGYHISINGKTENYVPKFKRVMRSLTQIAEDKDIIVTFDKLDADQLNRISSLENVVVSRK